MAITAQSDKDAVWTRIRCDPWIVSKMGITGLADAKKRILTHKNSDTELTSQSFYISIYFAPSRKCYDVAFLERILEVDVLCPEASSASADEIMDQVTALLVSETFKISGRLLLYDSDVGDLAAPSGFYGVGTRYSFYTGTSAPLKIKTV